jgi:F420-dependent methylenetetrahydromethanopterin dehydrogenase
LRETQATQVIDFGLDLRAEREQIDVTVAALEAELRPGRREVVQNHLGHRELVEVRVRKHLNNVSVGPVNFAFEHEFSILIK